MGHDPHDDEIAAAKNGRVLMAAERITGIANAKPLRSITILPGARLVKVSGDISSLVVSMRLGASLYRLTIPREAWQHLDLEPIRRPREPA